MNVKKNLKIFVITIGVVLVWRGVWGLADIYLFPSEPTLSLLVSILVGLVILFLANPKRKDINELL